MALVYKAIRRGYAIVGMGIPTSCKGDLNMRVSFMLLLQAPQRS